MLFSWYSTTDSSKLASLSEFLRILINFKYTLQKNDDYTNLKNNNGEWGDFGLLKNRVLEYILHVCKVKLRIDF